jgi:hypothetical protein
MLTTGDLVGAQVTRDCDLLNLNGTREDDGRRILKLPITIAPDDTIYLVVDATQRTR